MKITIGGSVFVRNAIAYDYCIVESIRSILPLCDQVVVLECQSQDDTLKLLKDFCGKEPKIKLVESIPWEVAKDHARLRMLANQAISLLTTDWHFMIQADEVLHEKSVPILRAAVEYATRKKLLTDTFLMTRLNLFGNLDHHIRFDLEQMHKPCSDRVIRLGRKGTEAVVDAEGIAGKVCDPNLLHKTFLFHYGMVRRKQAFVDKSRDMQSWFWGDPNVDWRILKMEKENLNPTDCLHPWTDLEPLKVSHPLVAQEWVRARREEYPKCPGCSRPHR